MAVLRNRGDGTFESPVYYPLTINPRAVYWPVALKLGDLDGDGHLDIVVANYMDPGTVAVLLNLGSGTFGPAVNYIIGDGSGPNDVVVGDFDADGRLDLATSNWVSETVTVLLNRLSAAGSVAP